MNTNDAANAYKTQQIMTASPEMLTLMLYNGAIRFINENMQAVEERKPEKAYKANERARNIINELSTSLDMSYDISKDLFEMYQFMMRNLYMANINQDKDKLEEIKTMVQEIRDAWAQAMKQVKSSQAVAK